MLVARCMHFEFVAQDGFTNTQICKDVDVERMYARKRTGAELISRSPCSLWPLLAQDPIRQ